MDVDAKYTLCLKVTFPGDENHDYMLLEKIESAFKTYQGIMKEEPITVVFNEPDTDDGETTGGVSSYTSVFFLYLYDKELMNQQDLIYFCLIYRTHSQPL